MARASKLHCDVWRITFPEWTSVQPFVRDSIWKSLQEVDTFIGETPNRRGFIGINRVGEYIAGFYVQEDLRETLRGTVPGRLVRNQEPNFEKLFFSIVLDDGLIVIQRTNLSSEYVSMNYTSMRRDFEDTLAGIFRRSGLNIRRILLEKFYRLRTQEEMRTIFSDNTSVEIVVVDLHLKTVPDTIQLSNPDPTEEVFLKRLFNREFETIDAETLKAAPGQDLRKTKSGKAAVNSGKVKRIIAQRRNGDLEIFETEQDEKIIVEIDDDKDHITEWEIHGLIEIIEFKIKGGSVPGRPRSDTDLGPLFSQLSSDEH